MFHKALYLFVKSLTIENLSSLICFYFFLYFFPVDFFCPFFYRAVSFSNWFVRALWIYQLFILCSGFRGISSQCVVWLWLCFMGFFPTVNIDVLKFAIILNVIKCIYTFTLASEIHIIHRMLISTPGPYNYSLTFSLKKIVIFNI